MLRIKEVLKEKGINQIELSEKLGITRIGLNRIINGNPTIETLLKIANVLNCDVRDLIEPTKESPHTTIYKKVGSDFVEVGQLKNEVLE